MTEFDYSDEGRAARDLFVSEFTDYMFYVEDTGAEAFYERLLSLLFPNLGGFEVECLHGKENVPKKLTEKRVPGLSYVFIVDKDFDDLLGKEENKELIYLRKYSIENYLANTAAIAKVYVEELPEGKTLKDVYSDVPELDVFVRDLVRALVECTKCFVVIRKFWLGIENTKSSLDRLLEGAEDERPLPTDDWIGGLKEKIISESGLTEDILEEELLHALVPSGKFPFAVDSDACHIPGKHLLGCILRYFSKNLKLDIESTLGKKLYIRILNHIDAVSFSAVRDDIIAKQPALANFCG